MPDLVNIEQLEAGLLDAADIHVELAELNQKAVALAEKIQGNFEELGI